MNFFESQHRRGKSDIKRTREQWTRNVSSPESQKVSGKRVNMKKWREEQKNQRRLSEFEDGYKGQNSKRNNPNS